MAARILTASLILLAALSLMTGCTTRSAPQPRPGVPMTQNAQLTFAYLLYLDQRAELAHATQENPRPGTPAYDNALKTQRRANAAVDILIDHQPSALLYGEKASLYFNPEQADVAIDIIEQGLEQYPDDRLLMGLLVNAYLLKPDYEMATIILEQYSLTHQDDMEALVRLVNILVEREEYAQALDQIARIPKKERNVGVLYLMARSQSRLGNRAEAKRTIETILKRDPDHYETLSELAFIQEIEADFHQAASTYQRLLELGGPEPEIRSRIITLNLKLNRVDRALKTTLEGPDTKSFLLSAAGIFLSQDFPAQASAVLDRLAALKPVPPEYFFYKAVIAFDAEEDPEKALSFLDQIRPEDENHNQALLFRAQINMNLDQRDKAMNMLEQGRDMYPHDPRFDRLMAEYLTLEEDYDQAIAVLQKGLERHGDNTELLYQYGALLDMQGQREKALTMMERILEQHPEHAEALNYVGYTLAEEGRDLDRALVLVRNALRQKPDNGAITDSLAWVLFKMGRLDDAWKVIRQALSLMDTDPIVWEHYGDIAAALGKSGEAKTGYERALDLKPNNADDVRDKLEAL